MAHPIVEHEDDEVGKTNEKEIDGFCVQSFVKVILLKINK